MLNPEKKQFKKLGKFCDIFTCSCPISPKVYMWQSWRWQPMFPMCNADSWFQKYRTFFKKLYLYLSVLVWTMVTWRTDTENLPVLFVCLFLLLFFFFCLIQNSLRKVSASKAVAFLKHNVRQRNIQIFSSFSGQKITIVANNRRIKILGGKTRERLSLGS